jgi:hypothetical protein
MPGFFTNPRAFISQHEERAEIESGRREKRHADAQARAQVATRIRSEYNARMARPQSFLEERPPSRGYLPPLPYMEREPA